MKKLAILMVFALAACDTPDFAKPVSYNGQHLSRPAAGHHIGTLSYEAIDHLINRGADGLDKRSTILVTSVVNVDDLRYSSTFGRLIGDQASNRIAQKGYVVKELRLGNALIMREGTGEIILSRDARRISRSHDAQAIVAGTYAVGGRSVYVNLRLISPVTDRIISAVDFVAPLDYDVQGLLAQK